MWQQIIPRPACASRKQICINKRGKCRRRGVTMGRGSTKVRGKGWAIADIRAAGNAAGKSCAVRCRAEGQEETHRNSWHIWRKWKRKKKKTLPEGLGNIYLFIHRVFYSGGACVTLASGGGTVTQSEFMMNWPRCGLPGMQIWFILIMGVKENLKRAEVCRSVEKCCC